MRRILDVVLAGGTMLFLSPILLPLMIVLRFTGEGEVFYRQQRVGLGGRNFGLLKFATMLKNSPTIGAGEITIRNDPRILPLGAFLRKTKLNELPQLWNIVIGDMSIVGPRPMVPSTFEHYPELARNVLCTVRPGLTGVGSIVFRDEERYLDGHADPMVFYRGVIIPHKSNLELWYVENQSLRLYLLVIFATAWVLFSPNSKIVQTLFQGLPTPPSELVEVDLT
jgi:lipopolysaccharide/colanic/teichoic acid biosynthesis glycosyltransferase